VAFGSAAWGATITVNKAGDSGAGTLREAIITSNSNGAADTIVSTPGMAGKTITPETALPALTEGGLTINGDIDDNGRPDVMIDGTEAGGTGLEVRSAGNVIHGLVMIRFQRAIAILGSRAPRNTVTGCYVGTDLSGSWALGNEYGVWIAAGARYTTVGGENAGDGNVISGNRQAGVTVTGTSRATVVGNLIGLNRTGARGIGNSAGVLIADSEDCIVGGDSAAERNVISGNVEQWGFDRLRAVLGDSAAQGQVEVNAGIVVFRGTRHRVTGNIIGLDATGQKAVGNDDSGVELFGTTQATIGGDSPGLRNVISGNGDGVSADDCYRATVLGNYIGVAADGRAARGNDGTGVGLYDCTDCTVGGTTAGARNVICGSSYEGVMIYGGSGVSVLGNYIGVNATGKQAVGNEYGVQIEDGNGVSIGSAQPGSGNIICASEYEGIQIRGRPNSNIRIMRNLVGLAEGGVQPLPNGGLNIRVDDEYTNLTIGGLTAAHGNKIRCGEDGFGIYLQPRRRTGPGLIRNNIITGPTLVNYEYGIQIDTGSIGTCTARLVDNTISHFDSGIRVQGSGAKSVVVHNTLSDCNNAIEIGDNAQPNLGDLGDVRTDNDGGNVFGAVAQYMVYNWSAANIKAEGNDWGTTSGAAISALVYDSGDSPNSGVVDFDPLIGGIAPTSVPKRALQLTSLAAIPTAAGVEVAFALSAPGEVSYQVLNLAGRAVAEARPRALGAGVQRLTWNGLSASGTRVPAGRYLVRVTARDGAGRTSTGLASMQLTTR